MKASNYILVAFICFSLKLFPQDFSPEMKKKLSEAKHDTTRCEILAQAIGKEPDDKIWIKYNDEMMSIATGNYESLKEGDPLKKSFAHLLAIANYNQAFYYDNKDISEKAMLYYERSMKFANIAGNLQGYADTYINVGLLHYNQGNIVKALEIYNECLRIYEELKFKVGEAQALNNIAFIYKTQNDIIKAEEYYKKSYLLQEEIGDSLGMAATLSNIGSILNGRSLNQEALQYHLKSLAIREKINDQRGIPRTLHNIANTYYDLSEIGKAMEKYRKALDLFENNGDKKGACATLIALAEIKYDEKKYAEAKPLALRSFDYANETAYPAKIAMAAGLLKKIYVQEKDFKSALQMHELARQMKDSVNNEQTRKAAIKQQMKYEYEKKEFAVKAEARAEQEKLQLAADEDRKRQNLIIYSVIAGLALVSVFSFFIFRSLQKNKEANRIISAQKKEVEEQKALVEEKQREVLDSIKYAKRIQDALLTSEYYISKVISRK